MKFISWNIDSLNATLVGDSARALLSQKVLQMIIEHDPDVIALQETNCLVMVRPKALGNFAGEVSRL